MDKPNPAADFTVMDYVIEPAGARQQVQEHVGQWIGHIRNARGLRVVGCRGIYAQIFGRDQVGLVDGRLRRTGVHYIFRESWVECQESRDEADSYYILMLCLVYIFMTMAHDSKDPKPM